MYALERESATVKFSSEEFCAVTAIHQKDWSVPVNILHRVLPCLAGLALMLLPSSTSAQTPVLMQHNDISRSGANTTESILTPANVTSTTFGRLFAYPVDGRLYAQPLYKPGITINTGAAQGTTHNVVFAATENDSVYAFDADSNAGSTGGLLWQVSLIDAGHGAAAGEKVVPNGDVSTGDIVPIIGITGTGVIDPSTNTLYVVAKSTNATDTTFYQRLHAIDITTGLEKFGGPVLLSGSVPGSGNGSSGGVLNWDPKWENNRASLLLLNGIVYIAFAAHGDNGPWHGWVMGYNATSLAQTGIWCTSPNGIGSGVWMSGAGLAADVPSGTPFGRMFVATGNGDYTTNGKPYTNATDYGDSIVRLDLTNGVPTVSDEFTPYDQASLNSSDSDTASGGVLLLPDQSNTTHTHELVQVGKDGNIHLVDREGLGGYNTANDSNIVNEIGGQTGGLWSMPAYWNGNVYFWGNGNNLKAFSLANGALSLTPTSTSSVNSGFPGATPAISANGTNDGIVWAVRTDAYNSNGAAILYAFDATNVTTPLYTSTQNTTLGAAVKFVVPTITNGKVYVGDASELNVFGLIGNSVLTATPVISPAGESFTGTLAVSITDTTPGATIYCTTNGTTPILSTADLCPASISVSATETIEAVATAPGAFLESAVATQAYTLQTQTLAPTFSPVGGSYTSSQIVTLSDGTSGAKIYYTTDGSTPPASPTSILYNASTPINVTGTTTIIAVATSSTLSNSAPVTALYTITAGGTGVNYSNGFSSAASTMTFNGSTDLDDTRLQLTNGGANEAGSAFVNTPVNIQAFTTDFSFQLSDADADGITFTIQGNGPTALGPTGGGLGYGPDAVGGTGGIPNSVAIKFDLYNNNGEGDDSTGLYTDGVSPTTPAIDLTSSGIDLHSGDTMSVHLAYDGTTLSMTITDAVVNATFSTSWPINIPGTVGGNTAYVGFTGGTGGETASQKIESWTLASSAGVVTQPPAATPTFTPAAGTYLGTQTVTLSDSTSGAAIFYTTNGSMPTASSTPYTAPITVTATETINAIATATNFSTSAVGSAAYTIESQATAPTFSPAAGLYATAQSVTISSTSTGATIYYTTNGSAPSASSTRYTGPVSVSASETLQAIAIASGYFNSNVSSAAYTIGSSVTGINLSSGFTAGTMLLNGNAALNGTRLRITDGGGNEAASAWFNTPINIAHFTTAFTFQVSGGSSPQADGFAFVLQGGTTTALGPSGGGLGYGPDNVSGASASSNTPIANSVAVKFDLYSNAGEGVDSTGIYVDGASPTTPFVDMTSSGVNLHSGDIFNVQMTYDGTNLTMTITDTVTAATFTQVWPINIPSTVGGNTAFAGFTGGTGGDTAIQDIVTWTMSSSLGTTATPTFSVAAGTYITAQSVTLSDATAGATIYYTTNGSMPTTSSSVYSAAIAVSSTETIEAMAVAPGYSASPVASAIYTITPPAAAPTFSPAAGTYTTTQSVTLSDTTPGAVIHYTTNGTMPATSSPTYSSAISVSTTETIEALAIATGYSASPVAAATYTITPPAATPVISPVTGTYTTVQTVTITDATSGAVIHYTVDGTQPTISSPTYTTSFPVSATTTIKALAVATGYTASATVTSVLTIHLPTVNYASGFTSSGLILNGYGTINGTRLRLTGSGANEPASAWFTTPVSIQTFTSDFTFQFSAGTGNGFTFVVQNAGTKALGPSAGGLGYGPNSATNPVKSGYTPVAKSVAVKFDLHNDDGEGTNSTGLYLNGASPTIPATTPGEGVNLNSKDIFHARITYDGTTLTLVIIDTANTTEVFSTSWPVNIPSTVGGNTAYVGFTGATGAATSTQEVITWTYNNTVTPLKTPIIYSTATLSAVSSGPPFRTFTYPAFPDTTGTILDATKVGDNVTFTVNVATAGIYDVQLSYKKYNTRGISQLSINGTNVGATLDEYATTDSYAGFDFGNFTFPAAGNYSFKFTMTSKDAASAGYGLSFDDFFLTPQ